MEFESYWLLREVGTGIIVCLLGIISYALGLFIYNHRVSLTVEDREARDAAIGLVIIFGSLMVRAIDLWVLLIAVRKGWIGTIDWAGSSWLYFAVLITVLFGVMLTVKAFHPWPIWAFLVGASVGIPVGIGFL